MKGVSVFFISFALLALLSAVYGVQPRQVTTVTQVVQSGAGGCTLYGTVTYCYSQTPVTVTNTLTTSFTASTPTSNQEPWPEMFLVVLVVAAVVTGVVYIIKKRQKPHSIQEQTTLKQFTTPIINPAGAKNDRVRVCSNCGINLPLASNFCNECGSSVSAQGAYEK